MNLIRKVVDFIDDNEMKLTVMNNTIHIVNYLEITKFNDKVIVIKYAKGMINISGEELMISKLLNKEILVTGQIKGIEIGG